MIVFAYISAVSCAERGIKCHLLLRGEQPEIQTGYNLISSMYGNVTYIPRSVYADRAKMLKSHAHYVAGSSGHVLWFDDILEASLTQNNSDSKSSLKEAYKNDHKTRVVIVNEGAGDVVALLGNWNWCYFRLLIFGRKMCYFQFQTPL